MNNIEEFEAAYNTYMERDVGTPVEKFKYPVPGVTYKYQHANDMLAFWNAARVALIAQLEAAQNLVSDDGKLQYIRRLEARAEKAEAALSAANEKLSKPVVLPPRRSASYFVDEEFSNEDLAAIYNAARLEFSVKVKNAGFTVEGE